VSQTTVLVMIDGFDPEYMDSCPMSNLRQLTKGGLVTEGKAMMPTVTNVNNVSCVTASYPECHGITSNYWFNREEGVELYMESGEFIETQTMFQLAREKGARSLLVTAKDKLRRLLSDGATVSVSSEQPPQWVVDGVGAPPPIYSLEVNEWVIDAGRYILGQQPFDLAYLTTTDYAMHTYAPDQPESSKHMSMLDGAIGRLVETVPDLQLLITADHGMSSKSRMIALPDELGKHGIQAQAVPIIKDMYTVHHSNLGGCIYVYLADDKIDRALEILRDIDGVDDALPRYEAARKFKLMPSRIGDIMVLGASDVVFGDPSEVTMPPTLRSHGSLHEERVPIIGYGGNWDGFEFRENKDLGRYVFERVLS